MPRLFLIVIVCFFIGCGPDTIFVRPELDTPAQHVSNGHLLLGQGKWEDACREFERARDLDPGYSEAFVGLGIAYGHKGDFDNGFKALSRADGLAVSPEEKAKVQRAYQELRRIMQDQELWIRY